MVARFGKKGVAQVWSGTWFCLEQIWTDELPCFGTIAIMFVGFATFLNYLAIVQWCVGFGLRLQ